MSVFKIKINPLFRLKTRRV